MTQLPGGAIAMEASVENRGVETASDVDWLVSAGSAASVSNAACVATGGAVCPAVIAAAQNGSGVWEFSMTAPSIPADGTLSLSFDTVSVELGGNYQLSSVVAAAIPADGELIPVTDSAIDNILISPNAVSVTVDKSITEFRDDQGVAVATPGSAGVIVYEVVVRNTGVDDITDARLFEVLSGSAGTGSDVPGRLFINFGQSTVTCVGIANGGVCPVDPIDTAPGSRIFVSTVIPSLPGRTWNAVSDPVGNPESSVTFEVVAPYTAACSTNPSTNRLVVNSASIADVSETPGLSNVAPYGPGDGTDNSVRVETEIPADDCELFDVSTEIDQSGTQSANGVDGGGAFAYTVTVGNSAASTATATDVDFLFRLFDVERFSELPNGYTQYFDIDVPAITCVPAGGAVCPTGYTETEQTSENFVSGRTLLPQVEADIPSIPPTGTLTFVVPGTFGNLTCGEIHLIRADASATPLQVAAETNYNTTGPSLSSFEGSGVFNGNNTETVSTQWTTSGPLCDEPGPSVDLANELTGPFLDPADTTPATGPFAPGTQVYFKSAMINLSPGPDMLDPVDLNAHGMRAVLDLEVDPFPTNSPEAGGISWDPSIDEYETHWLTNGTPFDLNDPNDFTPGVSDDEFGADNGDLPWSSLVGSGWDCNVTTGTAECFDDADHFNLTNFVSTQRPTWTDPQIISNRFYDVGPDDDTLSGDTDGLHLPAGSALEVVVPMLLEWPKPCEPQAVLDVQNGGSNIVEFDLRTSISLTQSRASLRPLGDSLVERFPDNNSDEEIVQIAVPICDDLLPSIDKTVTGDPAITNEVPSDGLVTYDIVMGIGGAAPVALDVARFTDLPTVACDSGANCGDVNIVEVVSCAVTAGVAVCPPEFPIVGGNVDAVWGTTSATTVAGGAAFEAGGEITVTVVAELANRSVDVSSLINRAVFATDVTSDYLFEVSDDVELVTPTLSAMTVQHTVTTTDAEWGEALDFEVDVANTAFLNGTGGMLNIALPDDLMATNPAGLPQPTCVPLSIDPPLMPSADFTADPCAGLTFVSDGAGGWDVTFGDFPVISGFRLSYTANAPDFGTSFKSITELSPPDGFIGTQQATVNVRTPDAVSIGSLVWIDANGDGQQAGDEDPLPGVTVTLLVDDGNGNFVPAVDLFGDPVAPVLTGPDGQYNFDSLPAGDYRVQAMPPAAYSPSPVQTTSDDDDSEGDSNIASEPSPGVFESPTFTLEPGLEPVETMTFDGDDLDTALDASGNMTVDFGFVANDLALRKTVDPAFAPGADWITPGTTTVDFLIEVFNQGTAVEDFDVTDYVDTNVFTFDVANNPDGSTTGDQALPFTWDAADPGAPVASVDGQLDFLESVVIPVTLTIEDASGALDNYAEISRFDDDGDPSNGDSDPSNPNNPLTGPLVDEDSTPDGTPGDTVIDDEIDETDPDVDEDDHDIASIPVWDLSLVKTVAGPADMSTTPPTGTFTIEVANEGPAPVYFVDVTEYVPAGLALNAALTDAGLPAGTSRVGDVYTIDGPIAAGATASFDVVFDLTDLTAAPYRNAAEISSFDDDADPQTPNGPFTIDVDSTTDGVDDDDVINHNETNYDPDNDNNLNEPTPGDEDDHDIEELVLPFDLALRKRVDPTDTDLADGIQNGDVITYFVEVFNQGADVEDFDVVDYIGTGWTFDLGENPDGNTAAGSLGGPALPFAWDDSGANPVAQVDGVLAFGESVLIPVNLTVTVTQATDELFNTAEISRFDDDGDPSNGDSDPDNANNPPDGPLVDDDSTPDDDDDDVAIDDVIDEGDPLVDEDDHDIASTKWFDLALVKDLADGEDQVIDPANPQVTFDVTVSNQGPEPITSVSVTDTPPAGFVYAASNPASVTDAASGATVTYDGDSTFTIDRLDPDEVVVFAVTYDIDLTAVDGSAVTNAAEIDSFNDDQGARASDIDSVPDDVDTDVYVDQEPDGEADGGEDVNADIDMDGSLHTLNPLDEDDHDRELIVIPFDLALVKTLVSVEQPLVPDGTVVMNITVVNQGAPVETIDVTDSLDPAQWQAFDATLNPDGAVDASSTATAPYSFVWDATDPQNPVATLAPATAGDRLLIGESVVVPITVRVADGFDTSMPLVNVAEISNFDDDGDPSTGDADPANPDNPPSGPLVDRDSTPDDTDESTAGETIGGDLVDDALDGTGQPGSDEDDHDPVIIPIYDLALRKTVDPSTVFPVTIGAPATFLIEVINQGTTDATDVSLIDYLDTSTWEPFDTASNPAGTTGGDQALAYTWAASGDDAVVTLSGTIPAGDTVTVQISLTIAAAADLSMLSNSAEITGGTPTTNGDPVLGPDQLPISDVDSTPDTTDDDVVIDDETTLNPSTGDEDDHDIALVMPPTYSLGNQVWFDSNNDGILDADETPVSGVEMLLFTDIDGDGEPDDTNGDGVIDADDAVATDTTDADGAYLFEDLEQGDYVVGVAANNFEAGGALANTRPSDVRSDDANDDVDNNNDGAVGPDGLVVSTPITLGGAEPTGEVGLDNDPGNPDSLSNLTVDLGFWNPTFDLALRKTVSASQGLVTVGGLVTYDIEVFNQGDLAGTDVTVIDYLPASLELADPDWTAGPGNTATIDVPGPIAPNDSVVVEITVRLLQPGTVINHAEITDATPTDGNGRPLLTPTGDPIGDIDSTPDDTNDDPLVDDVIDGTGGDEDDHDLATIDVPRVRIGDFVWIDADEDGQQDPGELPIPGVVVNLLDDAGNPILDEAGNPITTTTDANGRYSFDVFPGTYIIEFDQATLPAGFIFTTPTTGDGATDSNADAMGRTGVITVDPTQLTDTDGDGFLDDYTWDAGIVQDFLPKTGSDATRTLLMLALLSVLAGLALLMRTRRRREFVTA